MYLKTKGVQVPAWAIVRGCDSNDIAQMLADVVPFEEQSVGRKYVLFYLDTFFTVNAKGGRRFSEGLAVCFDCVIPAFPEDMDKIEKALPHRAEYEKKILCSILERFGK